MQAGLQRKEAAEAEVAGATWRPEISSMARRLRRTETEAETWSRLSRLNTLKNKVRACLFT